MHHLQGIVKKLQRQPAELSPRRPHRNPVPCGLGLAQPVVRTMAEHPLELKQDNGREDRTSSVQPSSKREQGARLKRHVGRGRKKTMAAAPQPQVPVKKMAVEAGVLAGKETSTAKPEAEPCTKAQEESSPGPLLFRRPLDTAVLLYAAAALEQLGRCSGEERGTPALPGMCSSLILQPYVSIDPVLLQPQVPSAPEQAEASALEYQRKLEAAEALLELKNSSWTPSESSSESQPCGLPAPAGGRGLQAANPALLPRPTSSVSLPIGHLGCISLLT